MGQFLIPFASVDVKLNKKFYGTVGIFRPQNKPLDVVPNA